MFVFYIKQRFATFFSFFSIFLPLCVQMRRSSCSDGRHFSPLDCRCHCVGVANRAPWPSPDSFSGWWHHPETLRVGNSGNSRLLRSNMTHFNCFHSETGDRPWNQWNAPLTAGMPACLHRRRQPEQGAAETRSDLKPHWGLPEQQDASLTLCACVCVCVGRCAQCSVSPLSPAACLFWKQNRRAADWNTHTRAHTLSRDVSCPASCCHHDIILSEPIRCCRGHWQRFRFWPSWRSSRQSELRWKKRLFPTLRKDVSVRSFLLSVSVLHPTSVHPNLIQIKLQTHLNRTQLIWYLIKIKLNLIQLNHNLIHQLTPSQKIQFKSI